MKLRLRKQEGGRRQAKKRVQLAFPGEYNSMNGGRKARKRRGKLIQDVEENRNTKEERNPTSGDSDGSSYLEGTYGKKRGKDGWGTHAAK